MPPQRRLDDDFGSLPDEIENVRSALAWAWETENDGARVAVRASLPSLLDGSSTLPRGDLVAQAIDAQHRARAAPREARRHRAAGVIAFWILTDTTLAEEHWSQALALANELPETEEIVWWIQRMRAGVAWDRGDLELSVTLLEQGASRASAKRRAAAPKKPMLFDLGAVFGDL